MFVIVKEIHKSLRYSCTSLREHTVWHPPEREALKAARRQQGSMNPHVERSREEGEDNRYVVSLKIKLVKLHHSTGNLVVKNSVPSAMDQRASSRLYALGDLYLGPHFANV